MVDTLYSGRYKVEVQIGRGGMGVVYRAYDVKLRRAVALKVIAPHLVEDEEARARFLIEAQALAGLSHPNVVTVFDLAEDTESGQVFIVMELLNGLPLRKHITDPGRPPFYDMAIQVCRALEHAHSHGVLHRDIKPENIFVCDDGTVKLMDFGLARLVDGATVNSSGMVTGTVAYMAPEQLKGGALDHRADLYAAGVLFYEYLCGFTPFSSANTGTMLMKHLTEPPPPLADKVPGLSPDLEALVLRLLAKEPDGRYPSAIILRDSLERIRARVTTTAAPIVAPKFAGPAMPATLLPLVAPKTQKTRQSPTTPIRPVAAPSRHVGRYVSVFCVLLLGAILAFAFGETLQRIFVSNPEPVKKIVAKKTSDVQSKSGGDGRSRRSKKNRRDNSPSVADSGRHTDKGAKGSAPAARTNSTDAPKDESQSDSNDTSPEPDAGSTPADTTTSDKDG